MEKICDFCGDCIPVHYNYCPKNVCMVEMTKMAGGVVYTPNNLPIRCFKANGLMLEHEHGDHPDYIFPIDIEYIAKLDELDYEDYKQINGEDGTPDQVRESCGETHALLYSNHSIAVTMYETCSATWMLQEQKIFRDDGIEVVEIVSGGCIGGHMWKAGEWKISNKSLDDISVYLKNKYKAI
jgi:hypothetical protein